MRHRNNDVYVGVACPKSSSGSVNVAALVVSLLLVNALLAGYVHLSRKTHGGAVVLPWNWHKVTRTGARTGNARSANSIVRSYASNVCATPYEAPSCPLSTAAVPSVASPTALSAAGAGGATTYGLVRDVRVAPT